MSPSPSLAFAFSDSDFAIAAVVALVGLVLLYRLLRREPLNRIVRLGLFIERQRFDEEEEHTVEWPKREEPLD